MPKLFVATRFTHHDIFLLNHYLEYYINKLKVDKVLLNVNYRAISPDDEVHFNWFLELLDNHCYANKILVTIGPCSADDGENGNMTMLKRMVASICDENDYVIPADSDEFVEIPNLDEILLFSKVDVVKGHTRERISENGFVKAMVVDKNVFEQFPAYNDHLFKQCKIGLIKAKHFQWVIIILMHRVVKRCCSRAFNQ